MKQQQATGSILKRLVLSASFIAATVAPVTSYAAANGIIQGRITDKADGEGVVGASVVVAGTTLGTSTDINGNFVLRNVPASAQKVNVSIIGYAPTAQTVTVGDGQTVTINFALGQTTVMASEVVVGASLYKQDRMEVPVTANIVSKEKIKEAPNPTLDKVLEEVPGVNINRSAGTSTSTVQIRGSNTFQGGGIGTRVNAFYDGFPINTPDTGEIVWQSVNMNAADKVEVLKGAAATLYGSAAMGGVVNTTGALPDKFEVKAGSSIGFYDAPPFLDNSEYRKGYTPMLWNTYVGIGNKTGKWNYSLLYSHSDDDGYKENTWSYLNDIKFKARYNIDAKQYVQLSSFYAENTGGYASTWPYNVDVDQTFSVTALTPKVGGGYDLTVGGTDVSTEFNPDTTRRYDAVDNAYADDKIKRKNALVGFNYVNLISEKLSLDARLYYTYNSTRIDYNSSDQPQTYGFPYSPNWVYTGPTIDARPNGPYIPTGASLNAMLPAVLTDFNLEIYNREPGEFNETISNRYGAGIKLDWKVADNHRVLFGMDGNIVDVQSTQYVAELPDEGGLGEIQEKNIAFFLQDEWKITDRLTALLSARYDWSGINDSVASYLDYEEVINESDYPAGAQEKSATIKNKSVDAISPRIALNYKAAEDMAFRASWGRSFRAPTLAERFVRDAGLFKGIPNPDIDKETMTAYEVGVYKQFGDKISVDIAGYINDYEDLIESRNLNPNYWPILFQYGNIAKARIWGIETSINYRPTSDWALSCGYAYMNAKNKSTGDAALAGSQNPDPEWLAYRPEHTASASATWKANKKLAFNVNGRYVSDYKAVSSYPNPEGENYPGDFIVMNAGVKYQFNENVSGSFSCRNLGNVQYEEAEWFPAAGRTFVAGIDLKY